MGPLEYFLLYIGFIGIQLKLAAFILGSNAVKPGLVAWAVRPGEHSTVGLDGRLPGRPSGP